MIHNALAHMTFARPQFGGLLRDLHVARDMALDLDQQYEIATSKPWIARKVAPLVAKPLAIGLGAFGLSIVRKDGMELFEHLLKGGSIAGASELGNYFEQEIMEHLFRNTAIFAAPANVWAALWTAATGEANDSGTEVTGGSYAREAVNTTTGWAAVVDGLTDNVADVDFGTATANWGTILDVTLEDAATAVSNRYFYSPMAASKVVNSGDSFKFPIGDLDASVA